MWYEFRKLHIWSAFIKADQMRNFLMGSDTSVAWRFWNSLICSTSDGTAEGTTMTKQVRNNCELLTSIWV